MTAALLAAIAVAWVVLVVMAVSAASGAGHGMSGMSGMGMSGMGMSGAGGAAGMSGMSRMSGASGAAALRGLSDTRGMDGTGDMGNPFAAAARGAPSAHSMSGMGTGGMGMSRIGVGASMGADASMGVGASMVMWALMVVAMMLPTALPAVRHVAANTLRRRRGRAMGTFAAVYLLVWLAFGVVLVIAARAWTGVGVRVDRTLLTVAALGLAAAWQLSLPKRRALRDCHRPSPLPPVGRRATAGVLRFGLRNSTACVRSCWAMMLAMAVATTATTFWMVAITGLALTEKLALKPRQATRAGAVVLAAGSVALAASAVL